MKLPDIVGNTKICYLCNRKNGTVAKEKTKN